MNNEIEYIMNGIRYEDSDFGKTIEEARTNPQGVQGWVVIQKGEEYYKMPWIINHINHYGVATEWCQRGSKYVYQDRQEITADEAQELIEKAIAAEERLKQQCKELYGNKNKNNDALAKEVKDLAKKRKGLLERVRKAVEKKRNNKDGRQ